MIQLTYMSSATAWPSTEDLQFLLTQCRRNNERDNITGMLVYRDAQFLQAIEGDEADIHVLFGKISNDPRNNAVVKLIEKPIMVREFPSWTMGFKNLDGAKPDVIPGYVDVFEEKREGRTDERVVSAAERLLRNFAQRA